MNNKEQIQKIILSGFLVVGIIYAFFEFLLGPLKRERVRLEKTIAEIQPQIAAAKGQIAKAQNLAEQEAAAKLLMAQVNALIPEGSPVAWFPPRMAEFFKQFGIEKTIARMNNEMADKSLTGFRTLNWNFEVPRTDFVPFGRALAELENSEPLLEIQSIQLEAHRDEVQMQSATLVLNNIVRL